jgi:cell division protein FtsZ
VPTINNAIAGPGAIVTREAQAAAAAGQAQVPQQPDYGGLAVPSVWRTNRTMAAAKVDALSSGGMDDFEIPAFLRRQAD